MSEQEREETSPGATRSQHVVLMGPADVRMMTAAMRPGIERSRAGGQQAAPSCLVITPTPDQAITAADQARRLLTDDAARVVPVSGVTRARRVLAAGPVAVVTGTASDLLALRRNAALDLEQLQTVVIVGLDDILTNGGADTLQALLGDAPDEVSRVATIEVESPETEAFLEAQMHRARRIAPPLVGDAPLAVTPRFVLTSAAGRADALRAVLDESDPPSLAVVAHTEQGVQHATEALTRLGLAIDGLLVQVVRQPTAQHVAMTVLWEAPTSYEALAEALAARPVDAVALPLEQVAALLARCRCYIGNDTGVLNMAAALQVPAIGLFGGSAPLWHSRFIHPLLPPAGEHGMAAITVSQVLEALARWSGPDVHHTLA